MVFIFSVFSLPAVILSKFCLCLYRVIKIGQHKVFIVAIQYSLIGVMNTQYHCDYFRAYIGHIMLYLPVCQLSLSG
jgi:hypothetical protein